MYEIPAGTPVQIRKITEKESGRGWRPYVTEKDLVFDRYECHVKDQICDFRHEGYFIRALTTGFIPKPKGPPPQKPRKKGEPKKPSAKTYSSRCRDCGKITPTIRSDWWKAARPRCLHCGGPITKGKWNPGPTPKKNKRKSKGRRPRKP